MALTHPSTPADVVTCVLELVEAMERHNKPLSIPIKVLSTAAQACHAYAAALHAADLLEGPCSRGAAGGAPSVGSGSAGSGSAGAGSAGATGADSQVAGAATFSAAGSDLPARLRTWAADLRERFRAQFWCEDELGAYPALALDGRKQRVDGVASNMGHLLGTGILDAAEEDAVVARLLDPSMLSGYGVRTLSTTNGAYWPLRYHGGSVWTHDTGYILRGMLRTGHVEQAQVLARALLHAASGFDERLPELFSGQSADEVFPPMPYPASCRPQAWAAASAVPIAQALGGI